MFAQENHNYPKLTDSRVSVSISTCITHIRAYYITCAVCAHCTRHVCYLNGIPRKCFSEPRGIQVTRSLGGFQTRPWTLMKLKQQQRCWYRCNTLYTYVY